MHALHSGRVPTLCVWDAMRCRFALERQIMEFGQTPKQVFSFPHPSRNEQARVTRQPSAFRSSDAVGMDSLLDSGSSAARVQTRRRSDAFPRNDGTTYAHQPGALSCVAVLSFSHVLLCCCWGLILCFSFCSLCLFCCCYEADSPSVLPVARRQKAGCHSFIPPIEAVVLVVAIHHPSKDRPWTTQAEVVARLLLVWVQAQAQAQAQAQVQAQVQVQVHVRLMVWVRQGQGQEEEEGQEQG